MSILILNRSKHNVYPYETWLESLNEKLLLLSSNETVGGFEGRNYEYIEKFNNYESNGNIELRMIELHKKYNFQTIIAVSEFDLIRAASVRDFLGIKGQSLASALAHRNKIKMKQLAKSGGIEVPEFRIVNSYVDIIDFVETFGYPSVLKPLDGAGAKDVFIIRNQEDLENTINLKLDTGFEIEKFIQGDFYHVDGIVIDGEIKFVCPSRYLSGILPGKYNGSYILDSNNALRTRLISFAKKLLCVMPFPHNAPFHIELFHTPDNRLVLCEIASRVPGAKIGDCLEGTYNNNLRKLWIQSQCQIFTENQFNDPKPRELLGFILIPPQDKIFIKGPDTEFPDWVVQYELLAKPCKKYELAKHTIDYIASFIVKAECEAEMKSRLFGIADWFEKNSSWS